MLRTTSFLLIGLLPLLVFCACSKKADNVGTPPQAKTIVSGKVTTADGRPLGNADITLEHTVWYDNYVKTTANNDGEYKVSLPEQPEGSWTAKAQLQRSAYGQTYTFDLHPSANEAFNRTQSVVRNFSWKLNGGRPGGGFYGAHIDLYAWGTGAQMDQIKLVLTPLEPALIDGSAATPLERTVEDVAGTFMAKDIPIGKYTVQAVYAGKTLLLKNKRAGGTPAATQEVVFGKNGYLAATEYNIEFWVSE
ncbi:MAG TPA: hypothetical protein VM871_07350 [Flavisolibacter sp.]|nr:hypothetical protein [Flavisolibacter sp.]